MVLIGGDILKESISGRCANHFDDTSLKEVGGVGAWVMVGCEWRGEAIKVIVVLVVRDGCKRKLDCSQWGL